MSAATSDTVGVMPILISRVVVASRQRHPSRLLPFVSPFAFTNSNTARQNGVIGGGQIGYNYQFSPNGVLGFEADFQGSGERGSGQFADPVSSSLCSIFVLGGGCAVTVPVIGTAATSYQAKIDWFGTVRARLGVLVGDQLLIYGTGGLAYGKVAVSGNTNVNASSPSFGALAFTPTTAAFGASGTNIGWTAGAGIEGRFSYWLPPNWTWKLEYLYLDLGSINTTTPFVLLSPLVFLSNINGNITTHTQFTDNIVRVGLNYQFH
jgi:outer membrane immunogenic protein